MANRWRDWLDQAERDLEQAEASEEDGRHEWACFAAHQAAEKAVEALHLYNGQEAWGHLVASLLAELPSAVEVPSDLEDRGRVLDNFY
ncbi:MAG TPA: HEPN domain-containing protein, partial [Longimicrobiales bacterium]|nr:HEPN domain-containing protein [Longimicrobiales bacterium]